MENADINRDRKLDILDSAAAVFMILENEEGSQ